MEAFGRLGFPPWLIRPLAVARALAIAAILTNAVPALARLAYAGFFYHLAPPSGAHLAVGEAPILAVVARVAGRPAVDGRLPDASVAGAGPLHGFKARKL